MKDKVVSTDRKHRLMELVAQGMSNKTIAHEFTLTENTIKVYVSWLMIEYGVDNRTELARLYWHGQVRQQHQRWLDLIREELGDNAAHRLQKAYGDKYGTEENWRVRERETQD